MRRSQRQPARLISSYRLASVAALLLTVAGVALLLTVAGVAKAQDNYKPGPDSRPHPDAPQGEVKGPFNWESQIFPGTKRDYWVYVPAQYDADKAACVMVVQDGLNRARGWKLTTVLDNLIHSKEVPVTIGIFVSPGVVPAPRPNAQPRFNRSFEYDALGDRYARFLIEELLPEVGKTYNLSDDPNDRAIAGASSGGICAFNVAWERPDAFRRVLSTIGTFVDLRGGNRLSALVRKTEPKPLRVFLQDGSKDLNIYPGSWWVANQDMLASLTWAGYDVKHVWGTGGHNSKHAAAILPDALRWLWRDYPKPIVVGREGAKRRTDVLLPDEGWELVAEGYRFTEGPAVNEDGEVFFSDIPNSRIYKIGLDNKVSTFAENTDKANGLAFGPDGRLFACANGSQQIVAYDREGRRETIAEHVSSNDLVVDSQGIIYFTDPTNKQVQRIAPNGNVQVVDQGVTFPNGIALSPDATLLYVADSRGRFVYSYQIQNDGSLKHKQPYFHLHVPVNETDSGADGMAVDTEGRLYVTTRMGIQVCDQPGRVHFIISKPQEGWLSNLVFGGPNRDTLFVTSADKVFRRVVRAKGRGSRNNPTKPPKPRL